MSSAVDLRLQHTAVTLAEELNYARAADRLHITQSALTKQIRELEDHVSVFLSNETRNTCCSLDVRKRLWRKRASLFFTANEQCMRPNHAVNPTTAY